MRNFYWWGTNWGRNQESNTLHSVSDSIKYLGIALTEQMRNIIKFSILWRKKLNVIRRWKNLPCSWINRIKIIKMAILPKVIYRFNKIPIKTPTWFFIHLEKTFLHFIWINNNNNKQTNEKNRIPKSIRTKRSDRSWTIPNFKLYLKVIVIGTAWYMHTTKKIDQWNWIQDPDMNSYTYKHLTSDSVTSSMPQK